jgi:hypothetical protein
MDKNTARRNRLAKSIVEFAMVMGVWSTCHLEPQRYVATFGNRARLFVGNVDLYTAYSGAVLELEKINGEWCFTDRNYWAFG